MAQLHYITRGMTHPHGKPKVYLCCHPQDFDKYYHKLAEQFLALVDCSIWYTGTDVIRDEEFLEELSGMSLLVMPVTERLLSTENYAIDKEFPFALWKHIPVLPLIQEPGLGDLYKRRCGDLQYLDENLRDATALPYKEQLEKFLKATLLDAETIKKIQDAFDAYIFLSYRKKDRKQAQELMRLIHENPFCRDVAIWYDEFLVPGENFNTTIASAFEKSKAFVLTVTPSLLEKTVDETGSPQENYVVQTEYPMATRSGKPILPVEMTATQHDRLSEKFPNLPPCTSPQNQKELSEVLSKALDQVILGRQKGNPTHDFFIGLAYLKGIDVEVNHDIAVPLIRSAAEHGVPEAVELMVELHGKGIGVTRSSEKMSHWQNGLVQLRQQQFANAPSEEAGLAWLEDLDAQLALAMDFSSSSQSFSLAQQLQQAAAQVMESFPCVEVMRYMATAVYSYGALAERTSDHARALRFYRQYEDILRHCLDSAQVELLPSGIRLNGPASQTVMILLRDYCVALCSLGDALIGDEDMNPYSPTFAEAEQCYRRCHQYLTDPVLADQYPEHPAHLSASYSRLGRIERAHRRFDEAGKWYRKALEIDISRTLEIKQNRDWDTFDACARGLFDYGYINPQAPDLYCLKSATEIWRALTRLVPERQEYRDRLADLVPYVEEVEAIARRTGDLQVLQGKRDPRVDEILGILRRLDQTVNGGSSQRTDRTSGSSLQTTLDALQGVSELLPKNYDARKAAEKALQKQAQQERARQQAAQQERARQQAAQRRKEARKQTLKKLFVFLLLLTVAAGLIYGAVTLFTKVIPENKYTEAMAYVQSGDYYEAYQRLLELGDYKDAATVAASIRYKALYPQMADAAVGETFLWGAFEQNGDPSDGAEDIEWIVLKEEDGKKLVLAKNILGTVCFDAKDYAVWNQCLLRMWMNNDFYNNAFTKEERACISLKTIDNSLGGDTQDYVFALSEEEASLIPSAYLNAKARDGDSRWWLRTNKSYYGEYSDNFALTVYQGKIRGGDTMPSTPHGARPAMWLDLQSQDEKESMYQNALQKYEAQQFEEALPLFQALDNYKDAKQYAAKLPGLIQMAPYRQAEVGQVVTYGAYQWQVLAKEEGRLLLLSNSVLQQKYYHNMHPAEPGWEGCSLRQWLNDEFLSKAFSNEEISRILLTQVENSVNPEFGTAFGGSTQDQVFLLSYEEVMLYLPDSANRITGTINSFKPVTWWLRTPGKTGAYTMCVNTDGSISFEGQQSFARTSDLGVRPAIWLDISVD